MSVISEQFDVLNTNFEQLALNFDARDHALWVTMRPKGVPCFNEALLQEMRALQVTGQGAGGIVRHDNLAHPIRYVVLTSDVSGIFSLGGDLDLFLRLINAGDKQALSHYAKLSVQVVWETLRNYALPLTTIALVKGVALGGGMECAMASSVLVAERSAEMALPEIMFNLFPGMGAYSLLARKIGPTQAEKMLLSGKTYRAPELYDMGVVDILAEDGEGEEAVHEFIKKHSRHPIGARAIQRVKDRISPITFEELNDVVDIWVETALSLSPRDLKVMSWVISAQKERIGRTQQAGQEAMSQPTEMAISA